jgi:hypothetical protein
MPHSSQTAPSDKTRAPQLTPASTLGALGSNTSPQLSAKGAGALPTLLEGTWPVPTQCWLESNMSHASLALPLDPGHLLSWVISSDSG